MSWLKSAAEFIETVKRIGFEQALKVDFKGEENRDEALYVFWNAKQGILLCFDTWGDHVNGGSFYYNWIPKDRQVAYKYTHSGGFEKHNDGMVWIGRHDCRENLEENIKNLDRNGKFVVPWIKQPFLWLLHYKDEERNSNIHDHEYESVNKRRIAMFSKEIQDAIKGIEK